MSALASVIAAAEHVEETSKTAFYVAGAVLAAWAVVVGFTGIARPSFGGTVAATRGTILVTAVLVVATMATAILTA